MEGTMGGGAIWTKVRGKAGLRTAASKRHKQFGEKEEKIRRMYI